MLLDNIKNFRLKPKDQIGLVLFLAFAISTTLLYYIEERFNSEIWKTQPLQRYKMVDDILDKNLFINQSKIEIIDQLGYPINFPNLESDSYIYYIGRPESFTVSKSQQLILRFKNDKLIAIKQSDKE